MCIYFQIIIQFKLQHYNLQYMHLDQLYTRDGTIHLPPDSILSRYLGTDTMYCDSILLCCDFYCLFLTLDDGEKLNDTLNIQTVTKRNTHLSHFSCFISVFSKHKQTATKITIEKYFLKLSAHQTSSINKIKLNEESVKAFFNIKIN